MKKKLLYALSGLLLLSLILSFAYCAGCAPLDTTGLLEAAPDLISRSAEFNEIYYGEGIPYDAMSGAAIGVYYYADKTYLAEKGFSTVTELQEKTKEVFSEAYCRSLFAYAFEGVSSAGLYSRYSSNQAEIDRNEKETILVSSTHEAILGATLYDFSTLAIEAVEHDYATVSLSATVTYLPSDEHPDGYSEDTVIRIRFIKENGWKIDSATY